MFCVILSHYVKNMNPCKNNGLWFLESLVMLGIKFGQSNIMQIAS